MLDFQSCKWVVVLDHHYISRQTCEDHSSSGKKQLDWFIMSKGEDCSQPSIFLYNFLFDHEHGYRIERELNASAKQETWHGRSWWLRKLCLAWFTHLLTPTICFEFASLAFLCALKNSVNSLAEECYWWALIERLVQCQSCLFLKINLSLT